MALEDIQAFRAWLRTQQDRQDAVGDFARDFLRDVCMTQARTLSGIDRHLVQEHNVPRGGTTLWARDRAWREFSRTPDPAPGRPAGRGMSAQE